MPDDSQIVSLGAKGLSGMGWKDSVRGSILRVINVNLVQNNVNVYSNEMDLVVRPGGRWKYKPKA